MTHTFAQKFQKLRNFQTKGAVARCVGMLKYIYADLPITPKEAVSIARALRELRHVEKHFNKNTVELILKTKS